MVSLAAVNTNPSEAAEAGQPAPARPKYAEILADVVVQTRGDLDVSRQVFAGQPHYVIRDAVSFQTRSLTKKDYRVFSSINGDQTCAVNFEHLVESGILKTDEEEDYYGFLLSMHQRGLLNLPIANGQALYERYLTRQSKQRKAWWMKLLCWKVSFGNPDGILERFAGSFRWLFTPAACLLWIVGILIAARVVVSRWDEFVAPLSSILAMQSLTALMVILVALKAWHELGHAFACKTWGGEVPDYGVLMIVGTPCAFVDATAAWLMPSRFRRITVSFAGMYFESFVALAAVLIWVLSDSAWVRSIAHHTIVLSTLTTVLFNANPLMKFDGYFMLSDWLDIPNLKSKADESFRYVVKSKLLGLEVKRPNSSTFQLAWLALFGAMSGIYRVLIISGIVALLTWKLPIGGLALALTYVTFVVVQQGVTVFKYLWNHTETKNCRVRVAFISLAFIATVCAIVCLPIPRSLSVMGVTEFEQEAIVRAQIAGNIIEKHAGEGTTVKQGELLAVLDSSELAKSIEQFASETLSLQLHYQQATAAGDPSAERLRHDWVSSRAELAKLRSRNGNLSITAPADGIVTQWNEASQFGKRLADGDVVASIGTGDLIVRSLIKQSDRQRIMPSVGETVWIVFPWDVQHRFLAEVSRVTEAKSEHIRETALTSVAGGSIEVDPMHMTPFNDTYVVEARLLSPPDSARRRGVRAFIDFDNRRVSIAQWLHHRWLDFYRKYQQHN